MDDKNKKEKQEKEIKEIDETKEIKRLQEELEKCCREREESKNKYLRALADYQNFEKRMREEKADLTNKAYTQLIYKLLPFLDNLDKAEIFVKDHGLKMIREQFYQTLDEVGLKEIDVLHQEFDPHLAEAVDLIKGEKDNMVVEVVRKGYMFQDEVLRVAQVKVSKKSLNQ